MESMTLTKHGKRNAQTSALDAIASLFSSVLEEHVTPKQALLIINAILAVITAVFTVGMPFWFNVLTVGWVAHALRLCKREGLGVE